MNRLEAYTIAAVAFLLLLLPVSITLGQQSKFDTEIPNVEVVRTSLAVAASLMSKDKLTTDEIRQVYFAEKQIGKCVWGVSARDTAYYNPLYVAAHNFYSDSNVTKQCLLYVQKYRNRFRVVNDGWKGDSNFMEPTLYWMEQANNSYPNASGAKEIEFDLEFNAFIRRFTIDEEAKGTTCQQYFEEHIEPNLEVYLDVMTKEELCQWPADCERAREEFARGRAALLEKYRHAPFTKILQDIDPTMIVVIYSVC